LFKWNSQNTKITSELHCSLKLQSFQFQATALLNMVNLW